MRFNFKNSTTEPKDKTKSVGESVKKTYDSYVKDTVPQTVSRYKQVLERLQDYPLHDDKKEEQQTTSHTNELESMLSEFGLEDIPDSYMRKK